ncbi:MAG: cobalamin-binding protein [Saprospirales bacterium]|nr:MAG: cobalamin-binding protein [Saprospirales bacterium]
MEVIDQIGRKVSLHYPPKKIVSLVPSISELVWDLGLREELVGITRFCVNPEEMFRAKNRVGGTKEIKIHRIHSLKPDLVLANKEENTVEMVEALERDYPVYVTDVSDFSSALKMIKGIGIITNREKEANGLVGQLQIKEQEYRQSIQNLLPTTQKVLYLIWKNPWMAAGGDTYISQMLELAGYKNTLKSINRYPSLSEEELNTVDADFIFLSSEPYPFKEKHLKELEKKAPQSRAVLVDGEMFSWYGSRMLRCFSYFDNLRKKLSLN